MAVAIAVKSGIPSHSVFFYIVSLALIAFIGLFLVQILYNRFFHPLAKFPGPLLATFSNSWKQYHVVAGDLEHTILDLHRKHGKIIRIGPNHLDISDAAAVKGIYGSGRDFLKSSYYDAFTALRPNLFGVRDEEKHSARRKACSNGFSAQSVAIMEPFIDGRLRQLIKRLDRAAATGEVISLKEWIAFFVMDVLGELAFSRPFEVLESGDVGQMPPIRDHVLLATMSGQMPWLIPYINKVVPYIPIPSLQRMINGRAALRQLAITSVNNRLSSSSQRKDLLGRLLEELEQGVDSKGRALDLKDIQTEAFGFIIAGSHTTAATTTLLLWHLFHNREALAKLVREIDNVLEEPEEAQGCYPYTKLANLPYLQAVITENYRISPVFVMPLMRVVPPEGKTIAGSFIPGNTDVSICNHALHHDQDVFGGNLEQFDPERWSDETYSKTKTPLLMPFGSGHRACIGRNIAGVEICKIVGSLLKRYELEYIPEEGEVVGKLGGMPPTTSFGVADLEGGLNVRVRRRTVKPE